MDGSGKGQDPIRTSKTRSHETKPNQFKVLFRLEGGQTRERGPALIFFFFFFFITLKPTVERHTSLCA
jgi:hypothetical protein